MNFSLVYLQVVKKYLCIPIFLFGVKGPFKKRMVYILVANLCRLCFFFFIYRVVVETLGRTDIHTQLKFEYPGGGVLQ